MMIGAREQIDTIAGNVSNVNTPGYRSRRVFQRLLSDRAAIPQQPVAFADPSGASASLKATGNPLDLALAGEGWMLVRAGDRLFPVRSGQFRRDSEGRLADGAGRILQASGGGDLAISGSTPEIHPDGTILVNGQPEARLGVFDASVLSSAAAGMPADNPPGELAEDFSVRQGMVMPSDVDLAAEMVALNRAMRLAESGAKVFQTYDELLGRAITKLGDTGR